MLRNMEDMLRSQEARRMAGTERRMPDLEAKAPQCEGWDAPPEGESIGKRERAGIWPLLLLVMLSLPDS